MAGTPTVFESKRRGQRRVLPGPRPQAVRAERARSAASPRTGAGPRGLMARVPGPEGSEGPSAPARPAAARDRLRRAAALLAHVCGLALLGKR